MEQLALIGASIRVPGADSADALWDNLIAGRSSILPLPAAASAADRPPGYVGRAGWIAGIEDFDPGRFGYSFREAQHIDPQQRLLLTLSDQLLDAVAAPSRNVGVFVSVGFPAYLLRNLLPAGADPLLSSIGNSAHSAATRIAYKLNLSGPALTVECGCSSAMVALHMARLSILTGQCEMALVGACSLRIPAMAGYQHQRDGVLAEDGVCRPFDAAATGTVFSSGAVVIALKKLSAALRDGDDIWCAIRATAVNNDGSAKAGFTAPSVAAQRQLIERVYARAELSPRSVGYLEAHGTGTALGDPIEFQALAEAFAALTPDRGFCSLGSIKANVGHLDVAAGLAGVVKAALCLRRRTTPPLANFSCINPKIALAASPFYIQTAAQAWDAESCGEPRRAAVTSLGVGGTNAHTLLEEAPPQRAGLRRGWGLVLAAASRPAELQAKAAAIEAAVAAAPDQAADLAYASQLAAPRYSWRGAYYVDADAPNRSSWLPLGDGTDWRQRSLVLGFPGQGTQYPAMGRELYADMSVFRDAFDRTAALFRAAGAADPVALLGADRKSIDRTAALQPYLFTLEHTLGQILLDLGLRPAALLGHSLGEYVAATLAGVFDLDTAVQLVAERTRLMAAAPPGAMLAIPAAEHEVLRHLGDDVSLCIVNGARSVVLGGSESAIATLSCALKRAGQAAVRLNTSHAFHSHLMADASVAFERCAAAVTRKPAQIPIVSNLDGRDDDSTRFTEPGYWARHIREPVRFFDCLRTVAAMNPPPLLLELGPGRSISSQLIASFPQQRLDALGALVSGREREQLFGLLGQLWRSGIDLQFRALYRQQPGRIVAQPAAALSLQRCWIDAEPAAAEPPAAPSRALRKQDSVADWLYQPRWSPRPRRFDAPPAAAAGEVMVLSGSAAAAEALCAALRRAGAAADAIAMAELLLPGAPERLDDLLHWLGSRLGGRTPDRVVLLIDDAGAAPPSDAELARPVLVALAVAKWCRAASPQGELVLVGVQGVRTSTEPLHWWNGWVDGFCTVASQEAPGLALRAIDIDTATLGDDAACAVLARSVIEGKDRICALRNGLTWEREFRAMPPHAGAAPPLRRVLIVGGTGNVGLVYAMHLLRQGATHLALMSRQAQQVAAKLAAAEPGQIWSRRRRLLAEAKRCGAELCFVDADADAPDQVLAAVAQVQRRFGGLDAIVHAGGAAAAAHARPLFGTDRAHLETLYRSKLGLARNIDAVARQLAVPLLLSVSSVSAVLGGLGLLGYATSHGLLDAFAAASCDADRRWASVDWDAWDFYKEARDAGRPDIGIDVLAISEAEGLEALDAIARAGWPERLIVSSADLPRRHAAWVTRDADAAPPIERGERPQLGQDYVAPKRDTERRLAELWQAAIGLTAVGIRDNFFELGGDSLMAVTLVDRITRAFGCDIAVADIFEFPTVERLAARIDRDGAAVQPNPASVADRRAAGRRDHFEAMKRRREVQYE